MKRASLIVSCKIILKWVSALAMFALLNGATAHAQEGLSLALDNLGAASVAQNGTVSIYGTLTNSSATDDFDISSAVLNFQFDSPTSPYAGSFTDDFSFMQSGILAHGSASSDLLLFTVDTTGVPAPITLGGTVQIDGTGTDGSTAFSTYVSSNAAFQNPEFTVTVAPEPSPYIAFALGAASLLLLAPRHRATPV